VCRSDDAGIAVAPIMTIAGVGAGSAALDYEYGPVAVVLDLMNPGSAFGRLVGQTKELRRDKAKARSAGHGKVSSRLIENCESGPDKRKKL